MSKFNFFYLNYAAKITENGDNYEKLVKIFYNSSSKLSKIQFKAKLKRNETKNKKKLKSLKNLETSE